MTTLLFHRYCTGTGHFTWEAPGKHNEKLNGKQRQILHKFRCFVGGALKMCGWAVFLVPPTNGSWQGCLHAVVAVFYFPTAAKAFRHVVIRGQQAHWAWPIQANGEALQMPHNCVQCMRLQHICWLKQAVRRHIASSSPVNSLWIAIWTWIKGIIDLAACLNPALAPIYIECGLEIVVSPEIAHFQGCISVRLWRHLCSFMHRCSIKSHPKLPKVVHVLFFSNRRGTVKSASHQFEHCQCRQ